MMTNVKKKGRIGKPLKPTETIFYKKLNEAGLSMKEFCELTGTPYRTAQDWKSGVNKTPPIVVKFLDLYIEKKKNDKQIDKEDIAVFFNG